MALIFTYVYKIIFSSMKKILLILTILLNTSLVFSQKSNYQIKYLFDNQNNLVIDDCTISINQSQIIYKKGGLSKNFSIRYMGKTEFKENKNTSFTYHKYLLVNNNKYLYISDYKNFKLKDTFYYILILDGQKQLAL